MPKMRWCFTRFRHAARTARWPKMRWYFTSFGVAPSARTRLGAYATRCFRFLVLDQDTVAAHVRGVFLRADATRYGSHAV